jgi:hypothetical protein
MQRAGFSVVMFFSAAKRLIAQGLSFDCLCPVIKLLGSDLYWDALTRGCYDSTIKTPSFAGRGSVCESGSMIDCHQCEHYYVTWDKHFPHGCRAMKFKSKQIPGLVVFSSSEMDCQLFKEKKSRKGSRSEKV